MILIISSETDGTTNEVIRWLRYCGKKYIRFNETDIISIQSVRFNNEIPEIIFRVNNGETNSTIDISSYWFRRGLVNYDSSYMKTILLKNENIQKRIIANLKDDIDTIISFFIYIVEQKNKIGSVKTAINNKLIHLAMAKSLNIKTPLSLVATNKTDIKFLKQKKSDNSIITKCVSDGFHFVDNENTYALYTHLMSEDYFPSNFAPTFFQENIKKKWEIRIFYLRGKFYSMAIFSQNDKKTQIDFRRYNTAKPNYSVPFQLPNDIEKNYIGL